MKVSYRKCMLLSSKSRGVTVCIHNIQHDFKSLIAYKMVTRYYNYYGHKLFYYVTLVSK